jgi:hypothetical protein
MEFAVQATTKLEETKDEEYIEFYRRFCEIDTRVEKLMK